MSFSRIEHHLKDPDATVSMGRTIASHLTEATVIFLHGDLGAGKTTFSRGVVQGLGHKGNVKSPTFTLVEPYELGEYNAYHFDLYRLADPEELEYMGFRDYLNDKAVCLIEWPEKGEGLLPSPDLDIELVYENTERRIIIEAKSALGHALIKQIKESE